MFAKILNKGSGDVETVDSNANVDKHVIDLSQPSIIKLQGIGPEEVQSFDRQGTDLKMLLDNGDVIVIQDFFAKSDDGDRSDLVLVDDYDVMWWGQYGEEWSGFYFAEIETDSSAIPVWLWGA